MADPVEPPPLFESIDILGNNKDDEDLFVSARQVRFHIFFYDFLAKFR